MRVADRVARIVLFGEEVDRIDSHADVDVNVLRVATLVVLGRRDGRQNGS